MKVCVVGLGYIGFPTACLMASAGNEVLGIDANEKIVKTLREGKVHIVNEDGLNDLAERVMREGSLRVSDRPEGADAFVICVPTPLNYQDRNLDGFSEVAVAMEVETRLVSEYPRSDLSYVVSATKSIAPYVKHGNLVILESTSPPGTTENVVLPILESYGLDRNDIHLAHAPERVLPGAILREMRENDRIIGGVTEEATRQAKELYSTFVQGRILTTDATTAEFVKLAENSFRDVNIALANEFARISNELGINAQEAISLANHHPRVNILSPGPGVGGHCIPVDPYFIIERFPEITPLLQTARSINSSMPRYVADLVREIDAEHGIAKVVVLGTAYKPDVGDSRESPSLRIADYLRDYGFSVQIHDPYEDELNVPLSAVCEDADLLVIATDHSVYKELNPDTVARWLNKRLLLDTRLTMPVERWEAAGFVVRRLGDGRYKLNFRD